MSCCEDQVNYNNYKAIPLLLLLSGRELCVDVYKNHEIGLLAFMFQDASQLANQTTSSASHQSNQPAHLMSDAFHTTLTTITHLLKCSPGAITIPNIQRLANIYKLESFPEVIDNTTNLKRLSIAGKILVMDIDYFDAEGGKISIKDVKLILANDNNEFGCVESVNGENILVNCLTNYEDLSQFDRVLTQLSVLDNFTQDSHDLFGTYVKICEWFKGKADANVVLNYDDQFCVFVYGKFKLSLIQEEDGDYDGVDDIALLVQVIDGDVRSDHDDINSTQLVTPVDEFQSKLFNLHTNSIDELLNSSDLQSKQLISLFNASQSLKSLKRPEVSLQGLDLFPRGLTQLTSFTASDLQRLQSLFIRTIKLSEILYLIHQLKEQFEVKGGVLEGVEEDEDLLMQEFLDSASANANNKMEIDSISNEMEENSDLITDLNDVNGDVMPPASESKYLTVRLGSDVVEVTSDLLALNAKFEIKNESQSIEEFEGYVGLLRESLVAEGLL